MAPVEPCGQPRLFWHIQEGSHEVLGPHDCIATAERNFFLDPEVNVTRWRSGTASTRIRTGDLLITNQEETHRR